MSTISLSFLEYGPGAESYSTSVLTNLLSHPVAIAMVLSTIPLVFFPPLKLLRDRLSQWLRPKLSRYKTPLLVQFLIFFSLLAFLVLFTVVEHFFLDGSTARFVGLLAMETVVCTAIWVPLRAMLQVFNPAQDVNSVEESDETEIREDAELK